MNNTGNNVVSSDFLKVLLALKKNTFKDLNVAELATVTKILNNDITCNLLNNQDTFVICRKLQGLEIQENDIVVILFTNTDFRENLSRYENSQPLINKESDLLHSKSYGIIIGKI